MAEPVAEIQGRAVFQSPAVARSRDKPALRSLYHGRTDGPCRSGVVHTLRHPDCLSLVSFDAIAPWYRTLETIAFGNALQRARVACLDEIGSPRRVLILGEGNGRFLRELLRKHPGIEVDCVEASGRMIDLARRRLEGMAPTAVSRVQFLHRDITSWNPESHGYDLIVTHFFLDCFPADNLSA